MKSENIYQQHILAAIEQIEDYLSEISTYEDFADDRKTKDAVVLNLEIIGEAASHLSRETKDKCEDIPFNKIIAMRNRLVHEYFGVDTEVIWNTCKYSLPELKKALEKLQN